MQCHQRMTEPWSQAICKTKWVKFGHVGLEICQQTDQKEKYSSLLLHRKRGTGCQQN